MTKIMDPGEDCVYHYTDAGGLQGIIANAELWATAAFALNDEQELAFGFEIITEIITRMPVDHTLEADRKIFLEQIARFSADLDYMNYYIACASLDRDCLDLWRNYTGGQGYAIALERDAEWTPILLEGESADIPGFDRLLLKRWEPVIYERSLQEDRVVEFAGKYLQTPLIERFRAFQTGHVLDWPDGFRQFRPDLLRLAALLKHPAFSAEKEVRMVFETMDMGDRFSPAFRAGPAGVTPYLKIRPVERPLVAPEVGVAIPPRTFPLVGVNLGPSPEALRSRRERAVVMLMGTRAPWGGTIGSSEIPLAHWA